MSFRTRGDDLPKSSLSAVEVVELGPADALERLFRWVESEALAIHGWYLREKESKAKVSKSLRILAISLLTTGAIFPVLSIISDGGIRSELGYIAFAFGGGVVLLDRGFGYSSSWSRYMATGAALATVISKHQVAWAAWALMNSTGPDPDVVEPLERIIVPFASEVSDLLESETKMWATEFVENLSSLHSSLPSPSPGTGSR